MASGLLTAAELRSKAWRRLFPDVYLHSAITVDHRILCEAALIYAGNKYVRTSGLTAVSCRSAALLLGVDVIRQGPVELTIPNSMRLRVAGIHPIMAQLVETDLLPRSRLAMTGPERTAFDLARLLPFREAVAAIDALLHRRLMTIEDLWSYMLTSPICPGRSHVPTVFAATDGRAESIMETHLRLILIEHGLPRPTPQFKVYHQDGRFIARCDLAYETEMIAIEYEGDHHRDRRQFRDDIARINALQAVGWTIVRVTADDIARPERMVTQIRTLLDRRRAS